MNPEDIIRLEAVETRVYQLECYHHNTNARLIEVEGCAEEILDKVNTNSERILDTKATVETNFEALARMLCSELGRAFKEHFEEGSFEISDDEFDKILGRVKRNVEIDALPF